MGLGKILSGLFSRDDERAVKNPAADPAQATHAETPGAVSSQGAEAVNADPFASDNAPGGEAPSVNGGASELTEEKILEVLSNVYDPEIPIDIVNLGLIYGIEIDGGNVRLTMTMTAPGCPASTQIAGESKILVEEIPGVESVEIDLVWDPPWDPSKMSEEARQSMNIF